MDSQKRKPTRLKNYDYSQNGYYFITICTHNKEKILCDIVGDGAHDVPKIVLSPIGKIVEQYILSTDNIPNIAVDKYVIMPNHIHLILKVNNVCGTSKAPSPTNNKISHTISTFKRFVNKVVGYNIFQRSFHDHEHTEPSPVFCTEPSPVFLLCLYKQYVAIKLLQFFYHNVIINE